VALFNLLFSGGIVTGIYVPKEYWWIRFLSVSYYANQSLLRNQFDGWALAGEDNPIVLLRQANFDAIEPGLCILIMILYGCLFLALAAIALSYTTRHWEIHPKVREIS
jgi:hypothetical protein